MKKGKRITALLLSMVIALGSVCYKPTRAEAAVGGMLANMCLSTYMTATGISLVPNEATAEAICEVFNALIPDFARDYAEEVGEFSATTFNTLIENDCLVQPNGIVRIGHSAAALMGRFTAWLLHKCGFFDADGNRVLGMQWGSPSQFGNPFVNLDAQLLAEYPHHVIGYHTEGGAYFYWASKEPAKWSYATDRYGSHTGLYTSSPHVWWRTKPDIYSDGPFTEEKNSKPFLAYDTDPVIYLFSNYEIEDTVGTFRDFIAGDISVQVADNYEPMEEIPVGSTLILNTGIPFTNESDFTKSVLDQIAMGSLSPSYSVEEAPFDDSEAMKVRAIISAYLEANGFEFVADDVGAFYDVLISRYLHSFANAEFVKKTFYSSIANGYSLRNDGTVYLRESAANTLNAFAEWLITQYQFDADDFFPKTAADYYTNSFTLRSGEKIYPLLNLGTLPTGKPVPHDLLDIGKKYYTSSGKSFEVVLSENSALVFNVYDANNNLVYTRNVSSSVSSNVKKFCFSIRKTTSEIPQIVATDENGNMILGNYVTWNTSSSLLPIYVYPSTVTMSKAYERPIIDDESVPVIFTGVVGTDDRDYWDSIFTGVSSGVLSPSISQQKPLDSELDANDPQGVLGWLKRIWQSIISLPQTIADAFKGFFAVDQALVNEMTSTFNGKFGFLTTLHDLGSDLLSIDADSEPPVVYIHLEDAEGSIDYGGTVKALDMSWYQRYKADGDRIMSGFMWLGFMWLLFKRAPAIINGGEMVTDYGTDISEGTRRRKR